MSIALTLTLTRALALTLMRSARLHHDAPTATDLGDAGQCVVVDDLGDEPLLASRDEEVGDVGDGQRRPSTCTQLPVHTVAFPGMSPLKANVNFACVWLDGW